MSRANRRRSVRSALRGSKPRARNEAAVGKMAGGLRRLDAAFTQYAANLQDADLDRLDIELKLLKSSLDEDIGPARTDVPPGEKKGTA